jgi:16S rRNA (adenine1518-N6/adenine1519-N6)-dimethyltransferase
MEVKAKKSLGQNFLKDASVVGRIVELADIRPTDWVVEIGPGTGVLTEALAAKAEKVVAVELDRDLVPLLLKKFPFSGNVSIVEGDVLKIHLVEALRKLGWDGRPYKVVANIPYYITAPIIQTLLRLSPQPQDIFLMVQKEVAERVTAGPGDMSTLSVAVQYYADPEMLFVVPKEAFHPVPKVDSAILRIVPQKPFDADEDKRFFRLVRAGFAARRKTLVNNLAASLHVSKEEAAQNIRAAGLAENVRAQSLDVEEWRRLREVFAQ